MWSDDAASRDFLNFSVLARVIAGSIQKNGDRPLSIGVSGAWDVGKSTTLELLAAELEKLEPEPLVVRFHPWRHQTQDNVRAAFAECIAQTLVDNKDVPTKVWSAIHRRATDRGHAFLGAVWHVPRRNWRLRSAIPKAQGNFPFPASVLNTAVRRQLLFPTPCCW